MKKLSVYIVDDNQFILDSLFTLLSSEKFEIKTFNSISGLDMKLSQVDVLILDMNFNGDETAGLGVLLKIRAVNAHLKIFIFSNTDQRSLIETVRKEKADGYVYKDEVHPGIFLNNILNDIYEGKKKSFLNWSSEKIRDILDYDEYLSELEIHEIEILKFKAEGYSSQEVADKISNIPGNRHEIFSSHDVNNFLKDISRKWNIRNNQTAIIAKAIQIKVIDTDTLKFAIPDNLN